MPDSAAPEDGPRASAARLSRRALLAGFGALGVQLALAACAPATPSRPTPTGSPAGTPTATPTPAASATPAQPVNMSIWAHCDDDLIFFGTHLQEALDRGEQVHSVFLTAGDAGRGDAYALGREQGIMAAYDVMRGRSTPWTETQQTVAGGLQIVVRTPADEPRVSLRFFRLPDGNLDGTGFASTGGVSLPRLADGRIASMPVLMSDQRVTWSQLHDSLVQLIAATKPDVLTCSVPSWSALSDGDHPDHYTTGALAYAAWHDAPAPQARMQMAIGYPVADRPVNLTEAQIRRKLDVFAAYAAHDTVVGACTSEDACLDVRGFGAWIQREYVLPLAEVQAG